jgi:SAM-dependent methyltransferase
MAPTRQDTVAGAPGADRYRDVRRAHWNSVARRGLDRSGPSTAYRRRVAHVLGTIVPPGSKVLEVGCGRGDLLASLRPSAGVGLDYSEEMVRSAAAAHPGFRFVVADAHDFALGETFDFVILSDLLNDVWDIQQVLRTVRAHCHSRTRVLVNAYSRLWQLPLWLAKVAGLATPQLPQAWLTRQDLRALLRLSGLEELRVFSDVLLPFDPPLLGPFANRFLVKLWPFRALAVTNFIVARAAPDGAGTGALPTVSVVVPARNEAGNVEAALQRIPELGGGTEILFVEGHSTDGTYDAIQRAIAKTGRPGCVLLRQPGKGKGDAVRAGFASATGDLLLILDADLTVAPEDLPRFVEALRTGAAEVVNGVRLVYPMEDEAMRPLNFLGNKLFSALFTFLLGQPVKDTLCGTKALWRSDWDRLAAQRDFFGDFDPFGDFDLLFGAARTGLKIVDLPIRYRQRTYGSTNISRFRHGLLLLRMAAFAARRLKFV